MEQIGVYAATAVAIVATARKHEPRIDGYLVLLALVVASLLVVFGAGYGELPIRELTTQALAVSVAALVGYNGVRSVAERASNPVAVTVGETGPVVVEQKAAPQKTSIAPPSKPPTVPPGVVGAFMLMGLALLVASCTVGCGGAMVQRAEKFAHAARDVADVAAPCLVAAKLKADEQCSSDEHCLERVREEYKPAADTLDTFHAAWCAFSPDSEGCP